MLNIHDLERRWLRYKIKSYIPHALVGTGTVVALLSFILFTSTEKVVQDEVLILTPKTSIENTEVEKLPVIKEVVEVKIEVPQNTQEIKEEQIVQHNPSYTSKKETLVLKPSLHFMDSIEEGISPYVDEEEYMAKNTQNTYIEDKRYTEVNQETVEVKQIKQKKSTLNITRHHEKDDLKDVIRRFKKNKNPALSLFIAKRYYADKNYQKSYNYALMTNEIDKNIDESWIIFAKSLVKLGQEELAANTLKSYLKTNKSSAAQVLLRKIEGGTFK